MIDRSRDFEDRATKQLGQLWIPLGTPGFSGESKNRRRELLDGKFGADGWRWSHIVRGRLVPFSVAILEYEESYRRYLRERPALVEFLAVECGNVYDYDPANVFDDDYTQPRTAMNHYQDISVRRVIAELALDAAWPAVKDNETGNTDLLDAGSGALVSSRRARGFGGRYLLQIRGPDSPGYLLSPAVVPAWDPALLVSVPSRIEWYNVEGCGHLSVEAFWQSSKVVEVRYDKFIALGVARSTALEGI